VLHEILPDWLILMLLLLTLIFTIYRTFVKGKELYNKESLSRNSYVVVEEDRKRLEMELGGIGTEKMNPVLKNILKEEKKFPVKIVGLLFLILTIISIHSLLLGGKGKSIINLSHCSPGYWAIFILIVPILLSFQYLIGKHSMQEEIKKESNFYPYKDGDIRLTFKNVLIISLVSAFAGIFASLLGIGGGMVLSPLLLELGVLANVAAATSSFMILFTSISSIIQYTILGRIMLDYGIALATIGLLSSIVGQTFLDWLVRKYDRRSYIVFSVLIIILLATILLGITGVIDFFHKFKESDYIGFYDFCSKE